MRLLTFVPTVLAIGVASSVSAQATVRPAPSGHAIAEVTLSALAGAPAAGAPAPAVIRVDHGQPHLRGRKLHTDSLVPYDKAWRTGANGLTTFRTDVDLTIGGAQLAKGTYVLFTWPTAAGWKLIFQKNENQSATEYTTERDVLRIDLRRRTLSVPIESLTFWVIPSTASGVGRGELRVAWGTDELSADWVIR